MAPTTRLREGVAERLKATFGCATDGEVAERVGIHPATWSRATRGKAAPGEKLARALLKTTGMTFDELFVIDLRDEQP
ncbi:helix-turn-helix transcriptional regulator [Spongiactinospora sp. TRM90649]|uniref:helix-turn-helix domain-containing protein n=1 Tax=Spongiactinospora sp. TRM90649 TaxID=3031114 RepID=UPI0023F82661|nr:helix-turn-helix transcriptional regulator [Spongiactinospora sp. TRM90649]MDF5755784.1 helix-turn-helix transcriptional regulator [Spongiactinospora sp. TRM90649]